MFEEVCENSDLLNWQLTTVWEIHFQKKPKTKADLFDQICFETLFWCCITKTKNVKNSGREAKKRMSSALNSEFYHYVQLKNRL